MTNRSLVVFLVLISCSSGSAVARASVAEGPCAVAVAAQYASCRRAGVMTKRVCADECRQEAGAARRACVSDCRLGYEAHRGDCIEGYARQRATCAAADAPPARSGPPCHLDLAVCAANARVASRDCDRDARRAESRSAATRRCADEAGVVAASCAAVFESCAGIAD